MKASRNRRGAKALTAALGCVLLGSLSACGDGESRREFVPTESYGANVGVQAFRVFVGSRVSVFVGIESCSAPIGTEVTWMTVSVPADAVPGEYEVDTTAPADPPPGMATATITISDLTATAGDQALAGYVSIDAITADRVTGLVDVDFPDGRMAVSVDAESCL